MSVADSIIGATVSFLVWKALEAVGVVLPYELGAFIPLAGILVGIRDVENAGGSAIAGALVTVLLALATNDSVTAGLYFLVVVVGILSLL